MQTLTRAEMEARGWYTWYNTDYWVNKKVVEDPSRQDHTNYGMSFDEAVAFELENRPPIRRVPIAEVMDQLLAR